MNPRLVTYAEQLGATSSKQGFGNIVVSSPPIRTTDDLNRFVRDATKTIIEATGAKPGTIVITNVVTFDE